MKRTDKTIVITENKITLTWEDLLEFFNDEGIDANDFCQIELGCLINGKIGETILQTLNFTDSITLTIVKKTLKG